MAHAFKTISAKPTFGTLRENLYQSDYINRKKRIIAYCKTHSGCNNIGSNTNTNALNLENCNVFPVNKSNLIDWKKIAIF